MGKKMKIKVKRGKLKIKLKSGGDSLPLSAAELRVLLASSLASALGANGAPTAGQLAEPGHAVPVRLLSQSLAVPTTDEPTS